MQCLPSPEYGHPTLDRLVVMRSLKSAGDLEYRSAPATALILAGCQHVPERKSTIISFHVGGSLGATPGCRGRVPGDGLGKTDGQIYLDEASPNRLSPAREVRGRPMR